MINSFYIAGASSRSRTTRVYLEYLNPDMKISAFLVSPEMTDNAPVVDDVPVLQISAQNNEINTELPVYIATRGVNHPKLNAELRAIGFTDIIPVTMQLDSDLRNAYLKKHYSEKGREFFRMDMFDVKSNDYNEEGARKSGCIYVASSYFDS